MQKHIGSLKWLWMTLLSPFLMLKTIFEVLGTRRDKTIKHKTRSGFKHGSFNNQIELKKVKKVSDKYKCSINDVMTTLLSNSLHEYLNDHTEGGFYKVPNKINICIPCNMREKKSQNFKNDVVGVQFPLKISENFDESILLIKRKLSHLKNSYDIFGMYFLFKFGIDLLPCSMTRAFIDFISDRIAILFSNAYLTSTPLILAGKN